MAWVKFVNFSWLSNTLKIKISSGVYQHEEKLPSIRKLCLALNVSKNTVIRAYQDMDAAGLIYSTPKSGYRVKVPMKIELEQQGPRPLIFYLPRKKSSNILSKKVSCDRISTSKRKQFSHQEFVC